MSSETILVVDDQPISVQLLKRKLERVGLLVTTASNGLEALEQVRSHKAGPDPSGPHDARHGRNRGLPAPPGRKQRHPIHSGHLCHRARTSKESKLEGLSVGAVDFITKPIDLDETVARVPDPAAVRDHQPREPRAPAPPRGVAPRPRRSARWRREIAHNLNNLLGVVIGYLDLIKSGYDKPLTVKKNAQNVDDAIQRIVGIVRQLSTLVVKSRPELTRVALTRLIEGGIRRFHSDYKLTAGVTVYNPLADLQIDTNIETVEEVISKVLINAWESYGELPPEKRPISIHTRVFDRPRGDKILEIRVDDQGGGIAEDVRDRMFEPFVSSKRTVGVGMGLTIARHSLRSLGGEVTLVPRAAGVPARSSSIRSAIRGSRRARRKPYSARSRRSMDEIAFLGAGNMAAAMIEGLIASRAYPAAKISCVGGTGSSAPALAARTGIRLASTPQDLLGRAGTIVVAFKPQHLAALDPQLSSLSGGRLVLSVLAGKTVASLGRAFPHARNIVRSMPNTPGQIGAGLTGWCSRQPLGSADLAILEAILGALGKSIELPESQIDAFTAVCGSGPAYVFEFAAALRDAAVAAGFDPASARVLAVETLLGASRLLARRADDPEVLRNQVTSPNGVTAAGLRQMSERDFRGIIRETVLAAKARAGELSA